MRSLDDTVPFKSSTVHKSSAKGLQVTPYWESTSVEIVLKYTINRFGQFKQGGMLTLNIPLAWRNVVLKSSYFLNMVEVFGFLIYFIAIFPIYF